MQQSYEKILNDWKRILEQEKEYLEDNVFEGRFIYVRKSEKDNKQGFLLDCGKLPPDHMKGEIDSMWNHAGSSEALYFKVKSFKETFDEFDEPVEDDYVCDVSDKPSLGMVIKITRRTWKLGESLPQEGTLTLKSKTSHFPLDYECYWSSDTDGTFSFLILEENNQNLEEKVMQASKFLEQQTSQSEILFKSKTSIGSSIEGRLETVKPCFQIMMRNSNNKSHHINGTGSLRRDIKRELALFKRQINAVEQFGQGRMAEPQLQKILLNTAAGIRTDELSGSKEILQTSPKEHNKQMDPFISSVLTDANYEDSDIYLNQGEEINSQPIQRFIPSEFPDICFKNKNLDRYQRAAVHGALNQKPVFLIHGPPGTGKTTVIVEIIQQILAKDNNKRILVCSQTNLAVDNVLEKLEEVEDTANAVIRPVRFAYDDSKISDSVKHLWLNNCLRQWGKERIKQSKKYLEENRDVVSQQNSLEVEAILKEYHQLLREVGRRNQESQDKNPFEEEFIKSRNVVGSTCVHLGGFRYRDIKDFDFVIMDEASKATPAEALIPILRAKQLIMIGDHKQLPPFVTNHEDIRERVKRDEDLPENLEYSDEEFSKKYGISLFEILINNFSESKQSHLYHRLNIQRRMPEQIGQLISDYFYDKELQSCEKERNRSLLPFEKPTSIVFVNSSYRDDRHDIKDGASRQNQCNAEIIEETLKTLDENLQDKKEIAVIAGYRGQVELLREKLLKSGKKFKNFEGDIQINTVDGFQGRENDIVIFDIVRSNKYGEIGFLHEPRRLNVSLSRARELLIIIGDYEFLSTAKPRRNSSQKRDERPREQGEPILTQIANELKRKELIFDSFGEALE